MKFLIFPAAFAVCATLAVASRVPASDGRVSLRTASPKMLQDIDGKKVYLKNCRQCHSATGEPSKETKAKYPKIKSLKDPALTAKLSNDSITKVIKKGAGKDMKAFGDRLSDAEIQALVTYVRTLSEKAK